MGFLSFFFSMVPLSLFFYVRAAFVGVSFSWALKFSTFTMINQLFTFQLIKIFAILIDKKKWKNRFETKFEKKKFVINMFENFDKNLILSTKIHIEINENLTYIFIFDIRISCKYLFFKSNIFVMLFVF